MDDKKKPKLSEDKFTVDYDIEDLKKSLPHHTRCCHICADMVTGTSLGLVFITSDRFQTIMLIFFVSIHCPVASDCQKGELSAFS